MTHYRITVDPTGPMATELVSGTVWGHIAWAIRYLEGEKGLQNWLKEQEIDPWLVSSQMPEGMLPKPLLAPMKEIFDNVSIDELQLHKTLKKTAFISEKTFVGIRERLSEESLLKELKKEITGNGSRPERGDTSSQLLHLSHNRIHRITGRTPEQGGLFFEDAVMPSEGTRFQLFLKSERLCLERLKSLLDYIGSSGFGANASTGCGAMRFSIQEEKALFSGSGNRFMSLSHGVLTGNMANPRYRQHVHFGKLGGHFAAGGYSPFKYPILMMRPGATFTASGDGLFGQMLRNIHHDQTLSGIRHHALHLPICFMEVSP